MTEQTTTSKTPTHIAYHVRETGEQSYWDRIGVAWAHNDGEGFNLELACTPVDGRVTLRVRKDKPEGK